MVLQNLLLKFAFLDYGLDDPGRGKRVSSCAKHLERLLGHTQTPIIGFRCFPPRIKGPESDNRALPSRAKVLNDWSYTSALFICLYGVDMKSFVWNMWYCVPLYISHCCYAHYCIEMWRFYSYNFWLWYFIIIIIIIIINIQGWAIWPVPSPELQLLSPSFLRSPNCSLSLWAVVVGCAVGSTPLQKTGMFGGPEVSYHQTHSARYWLSILRTPYTTQNFQRKHRTVILVTLNILTCEHQEKK
jgi:hypothetical protein